MKRKISLIIRQYCPFLWEKIRAWTGVAVLPEFVTRSGILFIHIPKAAGTSICQALYGIPTIGHLKVSDWQSWFPHSWRTVTIVSVVRDPVDRFFSAFKFLKMGGMNEGDEQFALRFLGEFETPDTLILAMRRDEAFSTLILSHIHFIPQVEFLKDRSGTLQGDLLVPYERLGDFGNLIAPYIGRMISLPRLNTTKGSEKITLSPENSAFLTELYGDDYRLRKRILAETPAAMSIFRSAFHKSGRTNRG